MFEKEKLSGINFNDWFARLKLVLRVEKKTHVIEQPLPPASKPVVEPDIVAQWTALYDAHTEIACLMLGTGVEKFDLIQSFHACKQEEGKPVADYVLKMKGYVEKLERLGYVLPQDITVGLILNGLTKDFVGFVRNYNMHNMGKTIGEIHAMLIEYEKGLPKKAETPQVMMIKGGKIQKANKKSLNAKGNNKVKGKGKDKKVYIPKPKNPKPTAMERPAKDDVCHHYKEVGHWKKNCPIYLVELLKKKKQVGSASSSDNCHYAPTITRGVVSVSRLVDNGFVQCFTDYGISVSKNDVLYFNAIARNVDLKEIQEEEDTTPSEITSNIPQEVEGFEPPQPPQEEVILIRRGILEIPANYKAAMLDPESKKWVDAINAEMQSMIDNMVWVLVDLPPNSRLVEKSYTQTYMVDYEETFSPVADIRAIRIPISIAAFYDYEIWQMDVKTTFLNGYLDKDIYIVQPEGSIMYAVRCTRPDVAFAQNMTSRFQQNPGEPHWTAVKNILKYLRNTKDMFLVYGGNPSTELRVECYCDAGFETDRDDTKSQTGYVFVLNGGAVDWKSSKQSTTAMSATESEYIAASEAAMEAVWIRKFISGLGIVPTINEPLNMYCDNSAAVHYANEPGVQKGARHYQRRYHYVRECVELGEIRILKVHTDNNLADPFTKALSNRKLTQHARGMGLRPASSFM
ncbi:retrotransposon protein, putative, ty1-copia subclass [Tanacetum coccineum]